MKFGEWYNEDDHDMYNYPDEAMEAAWDAATQQPQIVESDKFSINAIPERDTYWLVAADGEGMEFSAEDFNKMCSDYMAENF